MQASSSFKTPLILKLTLHLCTSAFALAGGEANSPQLWLQCTKPVLNIAS